MNPQEIFLLERYGSASYFEEMLNAWEKTLNIAEIALQQFMLNLPPDCRNRPLPDQPDIVWGNRVLPNFRGVLGALDNGLTQMQNGDASAIGLGHSVKSAIDAQSADYAADWMPKASEDEFWHWQAEASFRAFNLSITEYAGWNVTDLTSGYDESRGPLHPPASWPIYVLDPSVAVATGQVVPQDGVYVPDCDDSAAQFLLKGYEALRARVGYDPATTHCRSRAPAVWTLVRRIADSGGGIPGEETDDVGVQALRCPAGELCPQTGYWLTPAKSDSRRHFKQGELMPDLGSNYGVTIWQWDEQQ